MWKNQQYSTILELEIEHQEVDKNDRVIIPSVNLKMPCIQVIKKKVLLNKLQRRYNELAQLLYHSNLLIIQNYHLLQSNIHKPWTFRLSSLLKQANIPLFWILKITASKIKINNVPQKIYVHLISQSLRVYTQTKLKLLLNNSI